MPYFSEFFEIGKKLKNQNMYFSQLNFNLIFQISLRRRLSAPPASFIRKIYVELPLVF
jgi:hypothetical protein